VRLAAILTVAAAFLVPSATAAPAAVDLQLDLTAAVSGGSAATQPRMQDVPNGGTVTIRSRNFVLGVNVSLVNPEAASARIRFELPAGLTWGADFPDPSEVCTSTPTTADCRTATLEPLAGANASGWAWDVIASAPGSYVVRAEIVESSPADSLPANNSSAITVVVSDPIAATVSAGAARLDPARPRAGSSFAATVPVTAGGLPLTPSGIQCSATVAGKKVAGTRKARSGSARCSFRTPASARGKTIRGSVSFIAGGKRITRQFSAKLR
jgi:hypothetical protein